MHDLGKYRLEFQRHRLQWEPMTGKEDRTLAVKTWAPIKPMSQLFTRSARLMVIPALTLLGALLCRFELRGEGGHAVALGRSIVAPVGQFVARLSDDPDDGFVAGSDSRRDGQAVGF